MSEIDSTHNTKSNLDQNRVPLEQIRSTDNGRHQSHHLTLPQPEDEGERASRREVFEEKAKELRDEKLVGAAGDEHGIVHGHVHSHSQVEGVDYVGESEPQKLTVENVGRLERQESEEMEVAKKMELGIGIGNHGSETGRIQAGESSRRNLSAVKGDSMEVLGDTLMVDSIREDSSRANTGTPSSMVVARESESPERIWGSQSGDEDERAENERKENHKSRPSMRRRWMDSELTVRGSATEDS